MYITRDANSCTQIWIPILLLTQNFRRYNIHSSAMKSVMDQFLLPQPPGKLKMWLLQACQKIT